RDSDIVIWLDSPDTVGDERFPVAGIDSQAQWIRVHNKKDLIAEESANPSESIELFISVQQESGLDSLMDRIEVIVNQRAGLTESAVASRLRHRVLLTEVDEAIHAALAVEWYETELMAEHLRQAADGLGRLTGRIDVEDVLGAIFSEFCIGK
ncbi:MAG: tRNA uridine-5-carboxymethylaminomethyl(34) synthesis GTPase MnmE, partial [Pseudomonadota bacterium]